jgi:predicted nicotinamide N-methyase
MASAFPTAVTNETVAGLSFKLEVVADFDQFLDRYLATVKDNLDRPPYYAHLWPASRALVTWMAERSGLWPGRRVLELGCGLGLPSITAAKLGARHVVACDSHPDNGVFLLRNASRNGVQVDVMTMDWTRPSFNQPFDLILGSDLVYERPMVEPLLHGVLQMLGPTGRFILADPGRPPLERTLEYGQSLGLATALHAEDDGFVIEFSRGTASPADRSQHSPV